MPYVSCPNARIYYEVHGSGPPLVLISGLGGDLGFWNETVARLEKQFQLITFDNRGIARSDAPDIPYSMALFADDVACLMHEADIDQAHILGFSMGGNIAQTFAVNYPQKVRKLIIAASFAKMNRQVELFLDAVLSVYESGATAKQMYELILPWLFSSAFLSHEDNAHFLEFDEYDPFQQPPYAFRRQYFAQKEFDSRNDLRRIDAQTLILAGEQDVLATVKDAQEIAAGINHSALTIIPDAGHLFNIEQRELFHNSIIAFLIEDH